VVKGGALGPINVAGWFVVVGLVIVFACRALALVLAEWARSMAMTTQVLRALMREVEVVY
jgi:hypothetical protein